MGALRYFSLLLVLCGLTGQLLFAEELRLSVRATYNGKQIPGAEVCFFPYDFYDPFSGFDAPPYRCFPADKFISFPSESRFAFFVRHEPGLISPTIGALDTPPDARGLRRFVFELQPAATLDLARIIEELHSTERLALILGGADGSSPYVMPVWETRTLIPSDVPVAPVLIRDDHVAAVGSPVRVGAGETEEISRIDDVSSAVLRVLPEDPATGDVPSVSGGPCEKTYHPDSLETLNAQKTPEVRLIDGKGIVHDPSIQVAKTEHMVVGLYVFRDFADGAARLEVGGGHWQERGYDLVLRPGTNLLTEPFAARLGGSLSIHTRNPVQLALDHSQLRCDPEEETGDTRGSITLSKCPDESDQHPGRCAEVKLLQTASQQDVYDVDGIEPGLYKLSAYLGEELLARVEAKVPVGGTAVAELSEILAPFFTGRVSMGGEPLTGTIRFRSDEAVAGPDGEYIAIVKEEPGKRPVRFSSCDHAVLYSYAPEVEIISGSIVDIEVPTNAVITTVRDAQTKEALPNAQAMVAVLKDREHPDHVAYFSPAVLEGEEKISRYIDEGKPFVVCGAQDGYKQSCSSEVRMKREGVERVTLYLEPATGRRGRVSSPGYDRVYWSRPDGTLTEVVQVERDGTFQYQEPHGPDEFVVLVGSAPMYFVPAPQPTGEVLEIAVHSTGSQTITASLDEQSSRNSALIALWVDGVLVPSQALHTHQLMRRQSAWIVDRAPATFGDLPEGNLMLAAGPDPAVLPPGSDFTSPALFVGSVRRAPENGVVIFP